MRTLRRALCKIEAKDWTFDAYLSTLVASISTDTVLVPPPVRTNVWSFVTGRLPKSAELS